MNSQEPGQWLSAAGGSVMLVVFLLCAAGVAAPWWTEMTEVANMKTETEVSLWLTFVRTEETLDSSTLNCEKHCDITRLGSTEIREKSDRWSRICGEATEDELVETCNKLWAIRVAMLVAFFFALLYAATAVLALCGAKRGSSLRFPPDCGLFLGTGCLVCMAVAIGVALSIKMELPMNGAGFYCSVAGLVTCIPGILIAFCTKIVMEASFRKLLDVNSKKQHEVAPNLHKVRPAPTPRDETPREPPEPLNSWNP